MNTAPQSMAEELMAQLKGAPMQQMALQLGTNNQQMQSAIGAALPLLLGALERNAAQPQGADALFGALQRDHSTGSGLGDLLGSLLGGGAPRTDGAAILGHILGGNRQNAETQLGQATGMGPNAGALLSMLAPIVMAFLAKRVQSGNLDASALSQTLGRERAQVQQQGGLGGGLLGSLLDQNGDGKFDAGDLLKLGAGLLGGRR